MASQVIDERLSDQLAAPIAATDRIASLDVLRGFALLGILLANIQDFASPTGILHDIPLDVVSQRSAHHALDVAVMIAQWIFVEGKMRALFGLLFGAGTVLLLERIERRAGPELAADVFHRRNMWLLFFGIIHGTLIWNGDRTRERRFADRFWWRQPDRYLQSSEPSFSRKARDHSDCDPDDVIRGRIHVWRRRDGREDARQIDRFRSAAAAAHSDQRPGAYARDSGVALGGDRDARARSRDRDNLREGPSSIE